MVQRFRTVGCTKTPFTAHKSVEAGILCLAENRGTALRLEGPKVSML